MESLKGRWAHYFTSLCPHFLASKVVTIIVPDFEEAVVRIRWFDTCTGLSTVPGTEQVSYQC